MSISEKKALITGACGYSAPWVIRELLNAGWQVRATDLDRAPRDALKEFGDKIQFMAGDITKPETLPSPVADIDIVYHPAAIFSFSASMDLLRKVNVEGTKNIIEASMKANVKKMVMWSSVALYGNADKKFYPMPIPEFQLDKLNPKSGGKYDLSKREQEAAAHNYWVENKFPISYMRCAPLYGPGSYYGIFTLLKYINYEMLPISPRNLHDASVPLVHAEDVARAALFLSDPTKFNGEAYNIVDDNVLDMLDTLKYVATLCDSKFSVIMGIYPLIVLKPFLSLLGWWSNVEARHLRKKINGKPPLPKLESDTILYMFGNFWFSNKKIKESGFNFKYSDRKLGLLEAIKWYNEHGWEKPLTMGGA